MLRVNDGVPYSFGTQTPSGPRDIAFHCRIKDMLNGPLTDGSIVTHIVVILGRRHHQIPAHKHKRSGVAKAHR